MCDFHTVSIEDDGLKVNSVLPEVQDQFFAFALFMLSDKLFQDIQSDSLQISSLKADSSLSEMRLTAVVSSANLIVKLVE